MDCSSKSQEKFLYNKIYIFYNKTWKADFEIHMEENICKTNPNIFKKDSERVLALPNIKTHYKGYRNQKVLMKQEQEKMYAKK